MTVEIELYETKSISKNLLYSFIITVIIGLVNIVYPLVIGLIYGPETMGNFSVLLYWAILLNIPISNGIAPAISRFSAASVNSEKKTIENIGSKLSIFYFLGILLVYPILGVFVFDLSGLELVLVIVLFLGLLIHYLFRNSLQGQERFLTLLKYEAISFAVFLPFMVMLAIIPKVANWSIIIDNYFFLFIPMIVFHLIFTLIIFIKKHKEINFKTIFTFPKITKNILLYSLFIGLGGLLAYGMSKVQIIITDLYIHNDFELGVIGFWDSAIAAVTLFTVSLSGMLVPRITNLLKANEGNGHLARKFLSKFNWGFTFIVSTVSGLFILIAVAHPGVLDFLTLNKYNMVTYWLVAVLLLFKEINFLILVPSLAYILSSEKYVKMNPISSFIASSFIILSWIFLVPKFGIIGLAAGLAIGGLIQSIVLLVYILIITKGKLGLHLPFILLIYGLNVSFIILFRFSIDTMLIIIWSIITAILSIIGLIIIIKLLRDKEYTKNFDEDMELPSHLENKNSTINETKPLVYCVLANSFNTDPRVKQEVASLVKNNYQVYVLSWDREGRNHNYQSENYQVKNIRFFKSLTFNKMTFLLSAILFQIAIIITGLRLLRKRNKIILHINDFNTILGSVILKVIFHKKIKTIYDSHELTPAVYGEWYGEFVSRITTKIEKILMRFMDEIITVSPPLVNYFKSITKKRINLIWNYPTQEVIPKISQLEARKKLGLGEKDFIISYVGSLRQDVALLELIDAVNYLVNVMKFEKNILFIIVGNGQMLNQLKNKIKHYNLRKYIKIIGEVKREDSLLYLKASNLSYVLFAVKGLNTKIGMPWKFFESLVCGTKVLVLSDTYISKYVEKMEMGYIVKTFDIKDIAKSIESAYNEELSDIAIKNKYTWESQEEEFISIYKRN